MFLHRKPYAVRQRRIYCHFSRRHATCNMTNVTQHLTHINVTTVEHMIHCICYLLLAVSSVHKAHGNVNTACVHQQSFPCCCYAERVSQRRTMRMHAQVMHRPNIQRMYLRFENTWLQSFPSRDYQPYDAIRVCVLPSFFLCRSFRMNQTVTVFLPSLLYTSSLQLCYGIRTQHATL